MSFFSQIFDGRYRSIKKKMVSIAFVFSFLLCVGCEKQQEDVKHTEPPKPYCNTNEDGSIDLFLWLNWGTIPYDIEGPIYDHDMFSVQTYRKSEGVQVSGDYEGGGGGETIYIYRFTPSQPGETEIAALLQHSGVGYEGTLYNITVEDDLRCRLNWYGRVVQGENLEVFEEDQE